MDIKTKALIEAQKAEVEKNEIIHVIGVDNVNNYYSYCLVRKMNDYVEPLLTKMMICDNQRKKNSFSIEVANLSMYFDAIIVKEEDEKCRHVKYSPPTIITDWTKHSQDVWAAKCLDCGEEIKLTKL